MIIPVLTLICFFLLRMKAKKENKLGSAADGECTDLNGISDDEHNFDGRDFDDNDHEDFSKIIIVIGDTGAHDINCRREFRHK